jgi:hypothetical protein
MAKTGTVGIMFYDGLWWRCSDPPHSRMERLTAAECRKYELTPENTDGATEPSIQSSTSVTQGTALGAAAPAGHGSVLVEGARSDAADGGKIIRGRRWNSRPGPYINRRSPAGVSRIERILADRAAGMTLRQCGERAGISPERVRQILLRESRG